MYISMDKNKGNLLNDFKIQYKIMKKGREYTFEKEYENFYLYRHDNPMWYECFSKQDLLVWERSYEWFGF